METPRQPINLFITHVDKEGPFLKVWGQAEKNSSIYVEQFLLGAAAQFEKGIGRFPTEFLKVGTLVSAKYKDDKYYRARVVSEDYLPNFFVEVFFIDYGNKDIVPTDNVRSLQNFPAAFIGIPPLASGFIFAEAHCTGGEWNDVIFDAIAKELKYREVQCVIQLQAIKYYLVKLFINGEDVGAILIRKGLMQPIPTQVQQAVLLSMSAQKKPAPPPVVAAPPTTSNEINTYKACHLEPGKQYAVYVSFVNDGPTHFSVQLQQSEPTLAKLMKEINEIDVRLLDDIPLPGTICLARCTEDGNICRAVVTNDVDNQFKVFYVDFGNYETLPLESLYQIPFKYVLPKVMAIRLALNGIEKSSVTLEMSVAFKKFVDNRLLHMKVLPSTPVKKYIIPKCDLWDPQTSVTALDVIKRAALHSYPEPLQLNRGFTQPIKVSYVFSCNRFYVQLVSKEAELTKLMQDLQISCQTGDPVEPGDIKIGLPCCALFETDQLFYRGQIVDIVDRDTVKVRYIDYGNEEGVPIGMLRQIEGELLTVLRPQAIECCLTGYQNMPVDEERDGHWEELILEQQFTMKVIEMMDKKALVELIDANNYKAASLLLEKLAAAKSQVSPLLVQDGNKIEHRKTSVDSQRNDNRDNFRQERKPRDNNRNWNENRQPSNEKSGDNSWRQDNNRDRDNFRNSDKNSNDGGSWRQNAGNRGGVNDRLNKRPNDNNWNQRNGTSTNDSWGERSPKSNENVASDSWDSAPPPAAAAGGGDGWDTPSQPAGDGWGGGNDGGGEFRTPKDRDNNYGGRNKRFDNDRGNREDRGNRGGGFDRGDRGDRGGGFDRGDRNKRDGFKQDGFKKREYRKDGSEDGSESGFQKGPRTSSRNDHRGGRYNDRQNTSFASSVAEDSWNVSALSTPIDAADSSATFEQLQVVGSEAAVMISWFYDPTHFYCQLQHTQPEFRTMMEEIQEFYKGRKPESCVVGAPIVGLFPEDNVLYRAKCLEIMGGNYKVLYVDFGNIATITKVWPIEKKFMTMPAQAICCGLDGIAPNGDSWPEANAFSKFFQKESYMVRFLHEIDLRTYIELWDGQDSVAQLLLQENLAIPSAPQQQTSEIDIAYLLGQQFRVVLKSVNSLSDIIVALECGLALNCKMHNLDLASETFEDVLKSVLEQTLIVYVDNILEGNFLEVTFYDNDGNKLVVLTPDEGALDTVEALCPVLILNSYLSGFVAHADEKAVYVQPNQHADAIATLLETMFEAYENEVLESPIIPEEDMLYAIKSPDTNWYRSRCLSFDDDNVTVIYVDYGNTETVPFSELRELKPEFMVPHMLCVQVTLTSGTSLDYLEKDITATIYYGESGWEGTCQVVPFTDNTEVQQTTLTEAGPSVTSEQYVEPVDQSAIAEPVEVVQENTAVDVVQSAAADVVQEVSTRTPVCVSHIDSPSQFYVQFLASVSALDELQETIQNSVNDWPVLEKVTVGVFCAAPFSVDQQWYRAEVLDCDEDITTVRFIDFGNTDVISNETTQIKTLPSNLLSLAIYATRCSLKLKPLEEEWSQPAIELFEKYANAESVEAEFIIQDEKNNYVNLYGDGQNIAELLTNENHAVPCEIDVKTKPTCFISHLNSPSEFWVQMETCIDELEWIAEQLSGAEGFAELEDTSPGTLCAALFPDDEMWYRARILSNTVAGIELLFVDYGNSCISSSLRQLPEEVLVTPPLAQKCCLQKPEGIPYWTPEAQNKFTELSAEGQTIFTMKKITTGETAVVELLLNEQSVAPMLLPVTEDGYVKNFESLSKFSIEKNGEVLPEPFGLEPMPGITWNEESTQKFKELLHENSPFQIEIISDDTLRLYINCCDVRPGLGGEKISNITNTQPNLEVTHTADDIEIVINEDVAEENLDSETKNNLDEDKVPGEDEIIESKSPSVDSAETLPVETQFCDKDISETIKAVDIVTEAVQDTNQTIVDSSEKTEEADITPDSGRHSEVSDEVILEDCVQAENKTQNTLDSESSATSVESVSTETEVKRTSEVHVETSKQEQAENKTQNTLDSESSATSVESISTETEVKGTSEVHVETSKQERVQNKTLKTVDSSSSCTSVDSVSTEIEVEKTYQAHVESTVEDSESKQVPSFTEFKKVQANDVVEVQSSKSPVKSTDTTSNQQNGNKQTSSSLSSGEDVLSVNKTPVDAKKEDTETEKNVNVEEVTERQKNTHTNGKSEQDIETVLVSSSEKFKESDAAKADLEVQDVIVKSSNTKLTELKNEDLFERPLSRPSSRLSHDDRLLPATLSRPQSPIPLSPDADTGFKMD